MAECVSCGYENPEGARFCMQCATPLGLSPGVAEERKVVSALFCDLVGFTAASEAADIEDVARMLTSYEEMARTQIERHGGVVEKFIGDAVVGLFGIPVAHEDDPERAVRAALRIVEGADELHGVGGTPLRVRVGVNTGEAFVRLGVTPESGERFVSGDAINTAARLQSAAPEMGVAVGFATYEATAAAFEYEELDLAALKGKASLVRMFQAKAARARLGADVILRYDTPFIGRERELASLKHVFNDAASTGSVRLVTIVGQPGLGKSRIVAQLASVIDTQPGLVTWRQGRCLPYGDGITFWALGEILKAHAGISESDPARVAVAKLDAVIPEGSEAPWFRQRLLPLLGIGADSVADREELFTAWCRFLEHIAQRAPTVLVFEDLHWADDAMLEFLEHLADRAARVPLLVVGTARPELFERRFDYAAGRDNVSRLHLSPLSSDETARLVSAVLETPVMPAAVQQTILERAEGNPLYAEAFVRLLKDRNVLTQKGSAWELRPGAEIPLPATIRTLIAARLDTLTREAKSLLGDAAVIGKVFWAGAVASMEERDPSEVLRTLAELSRRDLVRPIQRSSVEGEAEFTFSHVLARDVAYEQLPRSSRASRHVLAARWIESISRDRLADVADVLAHHYATALELARATGERQRAAELEEPALRFLLLAGERALGLDTTAALANLERALTLAQPGHPRRANVLTAYAEAADHAGRVTDAADALDEAITSFRERGDLPAAARAMGKLSHVLGALGDPRASTLPVEGLVLLEALPPGEEHVGVLTEVAAWEILAGHPEEGIRSADRAIDLSEKLGLGRPARALGFRGYARASLGDTEGIADMHEAIETATRAGQGRGVAMLHNNLATWLWAIEGPTAALEVMRAGIALAHARGLEAVAAFITAGSLDLLVDRGEWDEALEIATDLAERVGDEDVSDLIVIRSAQARVLALRGHAVKAAAWLDWLELAARQTGVAESIVVGLASCAFARADLGETAQAATLLVETEATVGARSSSYYAPLLPAMVRTAITANDPDLAERLIDDVEPSNPYTEHALIAARATLAEARAEVRRAATTYSEAADRWESFGVVPEHSFALLGAGRCLLRLGRSKHAERVLARAGELLEKLGATRAVADVRLLRVSTTARP